MALMDFFVGDRVRTVNVGGPDGEELSGLSGGIVNAGPVGQTEDGEIVFMYAVELDTPIPLADGEAANQFAFFPKELEALND